MNLYARLFKIAIPLAIQQFIFSSVNLIDTLMIGLIKPNAEAAIASVGLSNQFHFIYSLLLFGLSSGGSIFIAQYWGAKETENISKTTALMLIIAFFFLSPFFILSFFFPISILKLFTPDPKVIELGASYLSLIGLTLLPSAVSYVFYSVLRTTEHAFAAMSFSIITLLMNAFLNWVFIFGQFGFQPMGVFGAGLATLIARVFEFCAIVIYIYTKNLPGKLKMANFYEISRSFVKRFFVYVLPAMANEFSWSMGITLYAIIYSFMGTDFLAAHRMMGSVESFTFAFLFAIALAGAVLIGQELGKENYQGATAIAKKLIKVNIILAFITGVVVFLIAKPILSLYSVKPEVRTLAYMILTLSLVFLPLKSMNLQYVVGILRSGGDTKFTFFVEGGTLWAVGVPLTAFLGLILKAPFIWVFSMSIVEELIKVVILTFRYRSKKWVRNVINHLP